MNTLEKLNSTYKHYGITMEQRRTPILTIFKVTSRRDELPKFVESFTLNVSTNKRLIIGDLPNG